MARLDLEPLPPAQPGVPLVRSVYNAASYRLGDIASPGELVSIFGAELAPAEGKATGFPLPKTLQGVRVTIGGLVVPLLYVSPSQINFQVPPEVPLGTAKLVVERGTQSGLERSLQVVSTVPGIFTASGDGRTAPLIVHTSDYSLVTPQRPARAGEYLAIFCTGLGTTNPSVAGGEAAPMAPVPTQAVFEVVVDSRLQGTASYAGLAPGYAGLYQVNFKLLDDERPGTKLLYFSAAGDYSNEVPLHVQ